MILWSNHSMEMVTLTAYTLLIQDKSRSLSQERKRLRASKWSWICCSSVDMTVFQQETSSLFFISPKLLDLFKEERYACSTVHAGRTGLLPSSHQKLKKRKPRKFVSRRATWSLPNGMANVMSTFYLQTVIPLIHQ